MWLQVFSVFSELVAGACRRADEGGDGGGGRSRMEDELIIFVRKQLGSTQGQHLRIGIIGTVALVQRLGTALGDGQQSQADSATGGPTDRLLVSGTLCRPEVPTPCTRLACLAAGTLICLLCVQAGAMERPCWP